jgi:ATP-dependent Clp protease ATP-binding subunit ClpC
MLYDRFSDAARKAMRLARLEAKGLGHEFTCSAHIFLGLIKDQKSVAARVLKNLNLDVHNLYAEVVKALRMAPEEQTTPIPLARAKEIAKYAIEEARNLNHNYVGTEHLLLSVLRDKEGMVGKLLTKAGISLEQVRREVVSVLGILR